MYYIYSREKGLSSQLQISTLKVLTIQRHINSNNYNKTTAIWIQIHRCKYIYFIDARIKLSPSFLSRQKNYITEISHLKCNIFSKNNKIIALYYKVYPSIQVTKAINLILSTKFFISIVRYFKIWVWKCKSESSI